MYHDGLSLYFREHSNKLDVLMYLVFCSYYWIRLMKPDGKLIPEDDAPVPEENKTWFEVMVLLNTVVIIQVFIKV